jgi:hypothetical protein
MSSAFSNKPHLVMGTTSEISSKSKTNNTTGKTVLKLVKTQKNLIYIKIIIWNKNKRQSHLNSRRVISFVLFQNASPSS